MNKTTLSIAAGAVLAFLGTALAWHGQGHEKATRAAALLSKELPAFFRDGAATAANVVLDNDNFTRPVAGPALHATESFEHYFDIELLDGAPPPPSRQEFLDLLAKKGLKAGKVGALPYAVAEWTEKLAIVLAEHRRWPDDKGVQAKCLVYAGLLAHYAEDLCQPLHTTIHFDGHVGADGKVTGKGIHQKVDALLGKVQADMKELSSRKIEPLFGVAKAAASQPATATSRPASQPAIARLEEPLFAAILAELQKSHELVGRVYELEADLPAPDAPIQSDKVRQFAQERMGEAATFTARLYVTAWRMSEHIQIPTWHRKWQEGRGDK